MIFDTKSDVVAFSMCPSHSTFVFFHNYTFLSDLTGLADLAILCFSLSIIFSYIFWHVSSFNTYATVSTFLHSPHPVDQSRGLVVQGVSWLPPNVMPRIGAGKTPSHTYGGIGLHILVHAQEAPSKVPYKRTCYAIRSQSVPDSWVIHISELSRDQHPGQCRASSLPWQPMPCICSLFHYSNHSTVSLLAVSLLPCCLAQAQLAVDYRVAPNKRTTSNHCMTSDTALVFSSCLDNTPTIGLQAQSRFSASLHTVCMSKPLSAKTRSLSSIPHYIYKWLQQI